MSRRRVVLAGAAIGLAATLLPFIWPATPAIVWNTTASAPLGLYRTTPEPTSPVGALVFVRPPAPLAARLAAAGILPPGVLLLKRIAAAAPSVVCRLGAVVTLDGRPVARALDRDRFGRPLPVWRGCRRLAGDVFLLNRDPHSYDSRYFGPLPSRLIVARAMPLLIAGGGADAR